MQMNGMRWGETKFIKISNSRAKKMTQWLISLPFKQEDQALGTHSLGKLQVL